MVVDDDDDMAFLVAAAIDLANDGLLVAGVASSGAEAMRKLEDADPDVIVLDLRMPDRNGLEVAAHILALVPEQNIVLFSAFFTDETEAEALRIGIRECVPKDQVKDLPDIIRKYCPAA